MAKKKLSASTLAAQQEYFAKMGIYQSTPVKQKKSEITEIRGPEIKAINLGFGNIKSHGIYIMTINKVQPLVYMTDREIVEKCLASYNEVLNDIIKPEMKDLDIYLYIHSKQMHLGICFFARCRLDVDICSHWFITQFETNPDGFWFRTPQESSGRLDLIDSISYRVEKLQEILNSML
jgi:hypothetical protein